MENTITVDQQTWSKLSPLKLVEVGFRDDVLSTKELRLLMVLGCRCIWPKFGYQNSRDAIAVAERFAQGGADAKELALHYFWMWDVVVSVRRELELDEEAAVEDMVAAEDKESCIHLPDDAGLHAEAWDNLQAAYADLAEVRRLLAEDASVEKMAMYAVASEADIREKAWGAFVLLRKIVGDKSTVWIKMANWIRQNCTPY